MRMTLEIFVFLDVYRYEQHGSPMATSIHHKDFLPSSSFDAGTKAPIRMAATCRVWWCLPVLETPSTIIHLMCLKLSMSSIVNVANKYQGPGGSL